VTYSFYISQNGLIEREGNTLYFTGERVKRHLPVMNVSEIIITAKVSLSSWAIDYLSKLGILVHFMGIDGKYLSSIIPENRGEMGMISVAQAICYNNMDDRLEIASEMVSGIKHNMIRNMRYYNKGGILSEKIETMRSLEPVGRSIESVMGTEGKLWSVYYSAFPEMFGLEDGFVRSYHPPKDTVNSLISYGNSLLYSSSLSGIFLSGLNPSISFLHEPSDRSFSLALDVADIFKPVIVERVIAKLLNNRMMTSNMFENRDDGVYLNDAGRKKFLEAYRNKMETVIKYGGRHISYASVIEQECHKILRRITGKEKYRSFRAED
jgi:CRISPR-associated protein Cas1